MGHGTWKHVYNMSKNFVYKGMYGHRTVPNHEEVDVKVSNSANSDPNTTAK